MGYTAIGVISGFRLILLNRSFGREEDLDSLSLLFLVRNYSYLNMISIAIFMFYGSDALIFSPTIER